jgi:predicted phosphodiesterase
MRLVLLSDVHANLTALEAVLADIAARAPGAPIYHLGDLVGYAPWPNEVVHLLRERGIPGVAGNYDSTTATNYDHCGCKYEDPRQEELSHLSYAWTLAHTSAESKRWLGGLPFRLDIRPLGGHASGPTVILVHGNPVLNTFYWTEDRGDDFNLKMARQAGARAGDVIAFGHTHKPWYRTAEGIHFVNTGSVGRPKDGDWRAGYVILESAGAAVQAVQADQADQAVPADRANQAVKVEFVRVEYDIERAAKAILDSELPDDFAEYLRTGGRA